jgi:hypothetical protein
VTRPSENLATARGFFGTNPLIPLCSLGDRQAGTERMLIAAAALLFRLDGSRRGTADGRMNVGCGMTSRKERTVER